MLLCCQVVHTVGGINSTEGVIRGVELATLRIFREGLVAGEREKYVRLMLLLRVAAIVKLVILGLERVRSSDPASG